MDIRSRVALRIRTIRKSRGLTQEDLAEMIERSVDAVSNIERGASLAGYDTLERLAAGLKVPVSAFFEDAEPGSADRTAFMERMVDAGRVLDDKTLAKAATIVEVLAGRKSPE
ncbi:Transcriptional regulator [uncultured Alphaproteobacteria bacterium]|uniref:Transcriptional regulator n=1 Tax=uncultured Alphaproteobacteria bacterium TaxID=91750 RepID=A0A212JIG1_9PROT|nr:Transcriptional regulator [uncultured Alphaproteobacteria bacterium]